MPKGFTPASCSWGAQGALSLSYGANPFSFARRSWGRGRIYRKRLGTRNREMDTLGTPALVNL